jgi:hypothetical protein
MSDIKLSLLNKVSKALATFLETKGKDILCILPNGNVKKTESHFAVFVSQHNTIEDAVTALIKSQDSVLSIRRSVTKDGLKLQFAIMFVSDDEEETLKRATKLHRDSYFDFQINKRVILKGNGH